MVFCIIKVSGDLNFVLYDDYNLGFFRFPKVNVEFKDGDKKALPAYLRGNYDFVNRKWVFVIFIYIYC